MKDCLRNLSLDDAGCVAFGVIIWWVIMVGKEVKLGSTCEL